MTRYNYKRQIRAFIYRNEGTILACFMGLLVYTVILYTFLFYTR